MGNEEGEKKNLDGAEKLELIDFSSEDDFLVDYPFRDSLEDLRLSVTFENVNEQGGFKLTKIVNPAFEVEHTGKIMHQMEQKLTPSESPEPRRASYLRKSLAWDNAFYTSAGVLDPEELSTMNKGFRRPESFLFPGIQEDLKMRRSVDSESTFDSDAFSLESFEGGLFEDIRASIHRSYSNSNFTTASCEPISGKAEMANALSSKKFNIGSQNMLKSMPASKRQSIYSQKSKTTKEASLSPQITQHHDMKGEYSSSSHKPNKIFGRLKATSVGQAKSASPCYGKLENMTTKTGYGPKKSGLEDSFSFSNCSTPPNMPSLSVCLSSTKSSSVSGSSCDKSSKFSSNSEGRKFGSNNKMASSGLNHKPPLRISGRSRSRLSNTPSSIHLLSMSNKSPGSSIDGWSSGSSSSTFSSAANRRSGNSEVNLSRGSTQASESLDKSPGCLEARIKRLPNQFTRKSLREAGSVPVESTRNSKPSGLRMPSPKLGFFDEENSMVPIVRDSLQFKFGAQNASSELNTREVKSKPVKLQPSRHLPGGGNELSSHKTRALHSASSTRLQNNKQSQKASGMRNSLPTNLNARTGVSLELDNTYCSKTRKVGSGEHDRRKVCLTSSLKTEGKRTKGILKNRRAENGIIDNAIDPIKKEHKESNLHLIPESKENLSNFEDQVNGLRKYFEIIDLGGDVMIELGGKRTPLAEKKFVCNKSGSLQKSTGLTKEKAIDKASIFPAVDGAEKENS